MAAFRAAIDGDRDGAAKVAADTAWRAAAAAARNAAGDGSFEAAVFANSFAGLYMPEATGRAVGETLPNAARAVAWRESEGVEIQSVHDRYTRAKAASISWGAKGWVALRSEIQWQSARLLERLGEKMG